MNTSPGGAELESFSITCCFCFARRIATGLPNPSRLSAPTGQKSTEASTVPAATRPPERRSSGWPNVRSRCSCAAVAAHAPGARCRTAPASSVQAEVHAGPAGDLTADGAVDVLRVEGTVETMQYVGVQAGQVAVLKDEGAPAPPDHVAQLQSDIRVVVGVLGILEDRDPVFAAAQIYLH